MTHSTHEFNTGNLPEEDFFDNDFSNYDQEALAGFEDSTAFNMDIDEMIIAVSQYLAADNFCAMEPSIDENNNNNNFQNNTNISNNETHTSSKHQSNSLPKAVYILGNSVPNHLLDKIEWSITKYGNRSVCGILTTLQNGKEIVQRVFDKRYWNSNYKLVYENDIPMNVVEQSDYAKLKIDDGICKINNKPVINIKTFYYRNPNAKRPHYLLHDDYISPDDPLLNPENKINDLTNIYVHAVFCRSGKDIPSGIKPCWTQSTQNGASLKGFIVIDGKKHLVINLTQWNMWKRWYTVDGRELDRSRGDYDNVIEQNSRFFYKQVNDDGTVNLIALRRVLAHRNIEKLSGQQTKKVVAFGLPDDLSSIPKKLSNDTKVFALVGLPIPEGIEVDLSKKKNEYVFDPNNPTDKAKVIYYKNYRNYQLVYADLTKKTPVDIKDCLTMDPNVKPLKVKGREVITASAWHYQNRKMRNTNTYDNLASGNTRKSRINNSSSNSSQPPDNQPINSLQESTTASEAPQNINTGQIISEDIEQKLLPSNRKIVLASQEFSSLHFVPALDLLSEPILMTPNTVVYTMVGTPVPETLAYHWSLRADGKQSNVGYVCHPDNDKIAARITTNHYYKKNYKLMYADRLDKQVPVDIEDCKKLNANLSIMKLNGREIITINAWYKKRQEAKKAGSLADKDADLPSLKQVSNSAEKKRKSSTISKQSSSKKSKNTTKPLSNASTEPSITGDPLNNEFEQLLQDIRYEDSADVDLNTLAVPQPDTEITESIQENTSTPFITATPAVQIQLSSPWSIPQTPQTLFYTPNQSDVLVLSEDLLNILDETNGEDATKSKKCT